MDEPGITSESEIARFDTLVTVIDAFNFLRDYRQAEDLKTRNLALNADDDRTIVDLLVEQIEFANVLVINKADAVSLDELRGLVLILGTLNPEAKIVSAEFGQVPLDEILNTNLFDFDRASKAPGWLQILRGEQTPETIEYGITSFVYRARLPFHPAKFWEFLNRDKPELLRSKGFVWLASHPAWIGVYSQAGAACRIEPAGAWWAETPPDEWEVDREMRGEIERLWDAKTGDRRQEIVFIGTNLNQQELTAELDRCLVSPMEAELTISDWQKIRHPFKSWDGEIETLTHETASSAYAN